MAAFIGSSLEDLETLAGVMDAQAAALSDIQVRVGGHLGSLTWAGPDLEGFADRWSSDLSGRLDQAATLLTGGARSVRQQAEQQRSASAGDGGAGAATQGATAGWATGQSRSPLDGLALAGGGRLGEGVGVAEPREAPGLLERVEPLVTWGARADIVRSVLEGDTPEYVSAARGFFAAGREAHAAQQLYAQTVRLEDATVDVAARFMRGRDDLGLLREWYTSQERVGESLGSWTRAASAFDKAGDALVEVAKVKGPWRAGLMGLTVVDGVNQVFHPTHDSGWRSTGDRVVGGATATAGTLALVAGAGLVTLAPPVALVVGGVLVAGTAWTVGNMAVDFTAAHWGDITHGTSVATDWVGHQASDAAGWAGDKASDAADAVSDGASHAGKAVGHKVSGAWHAAKGLF